MRVVLAPDKFKGTMTAGELVEAMAEGIASMASPVPLPVADGGDGSVRAALAAGWRTRRVTAVDAAGEALDAEVAIDGGRAIVEVAAICGLGARRPTPAQALSATTYGVGLVLRELLASGIEDITLALGGSATSDGGAGMLRGLGFRLLDAAGTQVTADARSLLDVVRIDATGADAGLGRLRLTLACDVDTPLCGPDGSAQMFAPQKGADAAAVALLARAHEHLADVLEPSFAKPLARRRPGSGAAGGLAWAGLLLGGEIRSGAATFLDLLEAEERVRDADLVITGEGRLDVQSLRGKAPVAVADLARRYAVPVVAIVGSDSLAPRQGPFDEVVALDRIDATARHDVRRSRALVTRVAAELVERHVLAAARQEARS